MSPDLTFTGVSRGFDGVPVLLDISLTVPLEGITFIVGRSGSGKSVLCRLAVGLLKPESGSITLGEQRVDTLPERALSALRARYPYIVQGPALLDWLTLEENAALASKGARADGRAAAALERVGLADFSTRKPPEVGPGIRKRAAIARALVLAPRFLFLDEPTTGLDKAAAQQVNETLGQLRRDGLGSVVVSHDYAALEQLADRVVEVDRGRLGFQGHKSAFTPSKE